MLHNPSTYGYNIAIERWAFGLNYVLYIRVKLMYSILNNNIIIHFIFIFTKNTNFQNVLSLNEKWW